MKIVESLNKLGEIIVFKKWEPIGTIKMFDREQDMSKLYYGTWKLTLQERSPIGKNPNSTDDRFKTAGNQFGEKEHTLIRAELPKESLSVYTASDIDGNDVLQYTHTAVRNLSFGSRIGQTEELGSGRSHNNIHPVEVVYFYKRVA